jgi:pSer/pThr/pTyr-binding forkhead associated (FHA) protein
VIKCPKCGKENQDHYKFCLGCGSDLPKNAPKEFQPDMPRVSGAPPKPVHASGPPPAIGPAPGQCPQCNHQNTPGNRFCAACGYKLNPAPQVSAAAMPAVVQAPTGTSHVTLTALRADGTEAGKYALPAQDAVTVGRDTGTIFAGDSYLSPRHATFTQGEGVTLRDEGSLNGVYIKLKAHSPFQLDPNSVFRIGQEIIRYEKLETQPAQGGVERFGSPLEGVVGRLALVIGRDTTGNAFPIPGKGLHLGRERGEVLFSEDGYVSGLHCRVAPEADGKVYLTDLGSSNGTFVRVRDNHQLENGDILLMGQQVFRVEF